VHAEPRDAPPLPGARQELELLRRSFAEAEQQGLAMLQIISNANEANLRESLRQFRPHILHYTGHATGISPNGAGLLLNDNSGSHFLLSAAELGILFQDFGVILAVLNGCETGVNPTTGLATYGICQTIIRQGVPVVIATTRTVLDSSAMQFTREFYRALMDGYPLDACISEARKGIRMQRWDWSAWAMYTSDSAVLDPIRLHRLPMR
jgi:CHAT domain-containing protein